MFTLPFRSHIHDENRWQDPRFAHEVIIWKSNCDQQTPVNPLYTLVINRIRFARNGTDEKMEDKGELLIWCAFGRCTRLNGE
jgi:hypothetical protein